MNNNFLKYKNIESVLIYGKRQEDIFLSIVIPTYKRGKLLDECLLSILEQEITCNFEIIVVDNNDDFEDKEVENIVSKYSNIMYYKNKKNIGPAGNWNRCVELANGKWVTMIHDDDYFNKDGIKKILQSINDYPKIDMFYFDYTIKDEASNKSSYQYLKKEEAILLLKEMFICTPIVAAPIGATFKKEIFMKSGGFNQEYYPSFDWEIILRIIERNQIILLNGKNIVTYRILENDSLNIKTRVGNCLKDYEIQIKLLREYPIKSLFFKSILRKRTYKKLKKIDKKINFNYSIKDRIIYFIVGNIFQIRKITKKYYEIKGKMLGKKYKKVV